MEATTSSSNIMYNLVKGIAHGYYKWIEIQRDIKRVKVVTLLYINH